jgi:glucose-1-phosphate cytidylyltransferase
VETLKTVAPRHENAFKTDLGVSVPPAILLCGGAGQRMGDLATAVPKPMLTVGGRPLLWHIMRGLAQYGTDDFVLAVGHLGHVIKDYFFRFQVHAADFTVRLGRQPELRALGDTPEEGWSVTCIDTGERTGTGGRLRFAARRVTKWPVIVAYGDVLADIDIDALLRFHRSHGRLATVTAAAPPARFGNLALTGNRVLRFDEKSPDSEQGIVNIGFFVLEQDAVERFIPPDPTVMFEEQPIRDLVAAGQLMAYRHDGFWVPVDTPKELSGAQRQWDNEAAPWKVWAS